MEPFLIFSECYRGQNTSNKFNTDIQIDNGSLEISFEIALGNEIWFFKDNFKLEPVEIKSNTFSEYIQNNENFVVYLKENVERIKEQCVKLNLKFYTIERNKAIFVVKTGEVIERYYHRFIINGKYSIEDCFL